MGRFASLVNTLKNRETFKARYKILARVELEHCRLGEWYTKGPTRAIVIHMIAFIEGGMEIPIGRITRDFLILYRVCPT